MTPPNPSARARAAAADALGVPATADANEARAAFLRAVAAEDLVPPEAQVAAVKALAGADGPLTPTAAEAEAAAVRADVDAFAEAYWRLTPAARRDRWAALSAEDTTGPDAKFLKHLKAGLDVAVVPHTDQPVDELAVLARDLFVLRPRARAVRRLEWLAEPEHAGPAWREAAGRLREFDPATANLDPVVLTRLRERTAAGSAVAYSVAAVPPEVRQRRLEAEARTRDQAVKKEMRRQRAAARSDSGGSSGSGRLGWGVAIAVAIGLSRAAYSCRTDPPRYTPPTMPAVNYNSVLQKQVASFTPEEIERFRRYDSKSGEPAPPGYGLWRLGGGKSDPSKGPRPATPSSPTKR